MGKNVASSVPIGQNCIQEEVTNGGRPGKPLLRSRGPKDPSGGPANISPSTEDEPTDKPPMPIHVTSAGYK